MIEFVANEALIKNNKSLKNRGQVEVSLECEREFLSEVLKLEVYPPGTHFKVTITPVE